MVESLDLKDLQLSSNADGFGPSNNLTQLWSDEFDGKLYQPFNKRERVGKVCDFVSAAYLNAPVKPQQKSAPTATQEILDEEDKGFEVVEENANLAKKKQKTPYIQGGPQYGRGRGGYRGRGAAQTGTGRGGYRPWQNRGQGADFSSFNLGKKGFRDQSIEVRGDWPVIVEFSKNQLEKLNPVNPTQIGDAFTCGDVFKYDADIDKSRTYKPTGLIGKMENEPTIYSNTPTLEDPVIRRLAQENKADIFATEVAIAAIMTAPKSLYSWDVQIKKYQDKLFIDKRDDLNMLDHLTVNETSHESQPLDEDSVNGVRQIMDEARRVQDRILYQQCMKGDERKHSLKDKDPFIEDEHQIAVRQGYVYNIWRLGNKRKICIRSTIHSYKSKTITEEDDGKKTEKIVYQNTYSLLEYEGSKGNWKSQLDMMTAQCLTKEVQDNSCKVSRWVVQSLLAGVDQIKFVFVTRKHLKDPNHHLILGTYGTDVRSYCNQINLNMSQCWAILQIAIDCIYDYGEQVGEYIFMKDPTKHMMRLFKVTQEEVDEDEHEEEL